ncbi:hypothetical protein ACFY2W_20200 [Streptomyces sp. NPDC001262]|uniref:hypothetical protein n=1 Tax=Streptomyces sp. NPDC001262 TaxID=3364552 RepID=UPI00368C59F5
MKSALRTGVAAAVVVAALAVIAPSASATSAKNEQAVNALCRGRSAAADAAAEQAMAARTPANPTRIKAAAYNQARSILAKAGSDTAAKSHPVHGTGDVPVGYGTSLLACSRDEFRAKDKNAPIKRSGMTPYHYVAIHDAARTMGIDRW